MGSVLVILINGQLSTAQAPSKLIPSHILWRGRHKEDVERIPLHYCRAGNPARNWRSS